MFHVGEMVSTHNAYVNRVIREMHKKSVLAVLERLSAVLDAKSGSQLADALEVSPQAISSWKSRESVPYAKCVEVAEARGLSLDWLLTGEGSMRRDEISPAAPAREEPAAYGISQREQAMLELFRSLDEDGQREIQGAAAEKKRLSDLEQRIEELAAAVAKLGRTA